MLADLYVTEKLRELNEQAAHPAPAVRSAGLSVASPAVSSLGRLLCRLGERLQRSEFGDRRDAARREERTCIVCGQRGNP